MNYEITFQPNKYNASDRELILNFKKALMRYYKKLLKARYNKHKDRQYKMDIDISHGNSEYSSTHPHLHIKADIPTNEIQFFMEFIKSYLKTKYPKLTAHCGSLISDLDNLKAGLYNLNQSVKYYNEQDIQDGNYII